ncbi:type IV minor pilin protein FimT [Thalassotalea insulae]|uniref:Type II secretion system protein H n=1 Tax=Thalassotalea insulae TaxID=2056778 RepID=A0ABQ6GMK6_9GAMM|nr:GspH/FimT family pseudopilin [Thalassotalea insulae]GLX77157.1 type IV minor pilin protein FimT [Thalassotalea insulae]
MRNNHGFTLIELLVTISILISLTAIAVPNFTDFIVKLRVDNEISTLYRLLLTARNSAINSGQDTTLCPLVDNTCVEDWSKALYVFTDANNDKQLNNNDAIIAMKPAIENDDKLQYAKGRTGITYKASGHLSGWGQNGTFKYCPNNHANKARGIIVAISGRLYQSFNKGNNKQDVNRSNTYITCSS